MPFVESDDETKDDSLPTRELHRIAGGACRDCAAPYSARDAVSSIVLGFKNAPRCLACLARRLGRRESDLYDQLTDYVSRRACYRRALREAERMDATPDATRRPTGPVADPEPAAPAVSEWDADGMGCGELVMALRGRLAALPAGAVLTVTATDPAAPEDLPAWCRLTGHALLRADHPTYRIRRRGD